MNKQSIKFIATKAKDDNSASAIANDMSANFDQSLPVEIDDKIHMLKQQILLGLAHIMVLQPYIQQIINTKQQSH